MKKYPQYTIEEKNKIAEEVVKSAEELNDLSLQLSTERSMFKIK